MERVWLAAGAALAFVAVGAGAFGAHALRDMLTPERLAVWETAVRYQMYHALALLAVGILTAGKPDGGMLALAGWAFLLGIFLFSGSLYLLCLTDVRWLGAITPLGGVAFLAGWALFAWGAWRG